MGYSAHVGSFNIDSSLTATETQSVTGVGFQPSIVLFWWAGGTNSGDEVAGGDVNMGFGAMCASDERWAVASASDDNVATTSTSHGQHTTYCIVSFLNGSTTLDGAADFDSFDADGFTLVIDDQFSTDLRVSYLALGGTDLTNVAVGSDARDGDLGNHSVTGVGFEPDALIVASAYQASAGTAVHAILGLGMATGSSNQGTVAWGSNDNSGTSIAYGYGYNGEAISLVLSGATFLRDSFVSFDADGFTLNQLENTNTRLISYVCLKGGQYLVSDLTTRTDGNDIEEDVGFEPVAVLFASANRALSTQDTATAHSRLSIGAGTATDNRAVQAISDENNLATTETAYTNQDDAVYAHVVDDAIEALMDIKSIDTDGFTCVMDDTESSACWVTYLAIGAEAAAAGQPMSLRATTVPHSRQWQPGAFR